MGKIYNKNQKKLQSLFAIEETVEVMSNIQMFKNIQTCLIIVYIIRLDFIVLSLMLCYLFLFLFSSKIYKEYTETKNNLLNRYSELNHLISQEFRDGKKLTEWQNERDFILDLLVQKKLLKRESSF